MRAELLTHAEYSLSAYLPTRNTLTNCDPMGLWFGPVPRPDLITMDGTIMTTPARIDRVLFRHWSCNTTIC